MNYSTEFGVTDVPSPPPWHEQPEIAEVLDLAVGIVKNHVSNILIKLGARDRTQAVLKGLELGLIGTSGKND